MMLIQNAYKHGPVSVCLAKFKMFNFEHSVHNECNFDCCTAPNTSVMSHQLVADRVQLCPLCVGLRTNSDYFPININ